MPKKGKSFLEKRSVVATFGIISLLGALGFLLPVGSGRSTGNFIGNGSSFSIVTLIGFLLLICSIVLLSYSVVHRD